MGFNEFYFLHDNAKASEYLMQSSKKPGAAPILASLATRLAYKASRTEIAIMFLQQTIEGTKDKIERESLEKRLKALQRVFILEKAVTAYKMNSGRIPVSLNDLLSQGVLKRLPKDPYGGEFFIDKDGTVKTTSDLR
jgi:competence protein ComGC